MIILHVTYQLLADNQSEYVEALEKSGVPQLSRAEEGNLRYDYFFPAERRDQVMLLEIWKDEAALQAHHEAEHFQRLGSYKDKFVKETKVEKFYTEG